MPSRYPAPPTAAAKDATLTVEDWTARAEHDDHDAQVHLCDLYFGGHGGSFDPQKASTWCHAAAESGDARSMWRMGLLSLAGVGTKRDFDAAAKLCSQAASHDATVPAGFCLAAIAKQRIRAGAPYPANDAAAKPLDDPAPANTLAHWHDLADRGDHAATAHLCDTYSTPEMAPSIHKRTTEWCRRAAGYGDANALRRLGLMRFWGVGMEKSGPGAEALCVEAHARDVAVSSDFCVAAVRAERVLAESEINPSHFAYPAPWPAASELTSVPNALGPDRVLETVHSTASGMRFSCRDLNNWSRYGLQLDGLMFGRPILQFGPQDYAALDAGAADCATAIAPYDKDGSERRQLAEFRAMLPSLQMHQQELARHTADLQAEKQRQAQEDATRNRDFLLVVAALSAPQNQCIDAVRRAWLSRRFSPAARSLEIRSVATNEVDGNTVVSGDARVIANPLDDNVKASTYSCTFDGQSQTIIATSVVPAAAP